ncbi:MAG: PAS domain S-box protein [Chloroherpetonaceae bacterium]|nr:PAS domain S-box protein [Chloroherpetonaceae bacterium]MDW8437880.1 PAS domain S-box protein [Chloroherpetonaceae bacterium]
MSKKKFEFPTEERFRAAVFENAGMAICVTDENGYFVDFNEAYLKLYGYEREEMLGKHFTMVVPEHYRAEAARIHDAFMAGAPEMPAEWVVVRKDGELRNIYVVPTLMVKDGIKCKVTAIADITEYKRMQSTLKAHGAVAEEAKTVAAEK